MADIAGFGVNSWGFGGPEIWYTSSLYNDPVFNETSVPMIKSKSLINFALNIANDGS